jgi:hypothetical protein
MKLYGVLFKSDRAIEAEENNRFPMTKAKAELQKVLRSMGYQSTLFGCELLLKRHGDKGEWHHVSKFAREVDYYDVDAVVELFQNDPSQEDLKLATASKPKPLESEKVNVKVEYREYYSKRNYRIETHLGPATITGDWIRFGEKRKRLSGRFIWYEFLSDEELAAALALEEQKHKSGTSGTQRRNK